MNTLFVTEIIDIKKEQECYEVTLYNNSGFQKLTADQIIDTTALSGTVPAPGDYISSKSINAILHSKEETSFPFHHLDIDSNQNI